jgi:putative Ca2+/H+ antiporter (TMEM165/GDT1 family)
MGVEFNAALTKSFVSILTSEVGDKTFFIAAILAMRYSRLPVSGVLFI